jgi:hypothetical protein
MDTALSYVLRNKTDLEDSRLLKCYTVIKKTLPLSMPLKAKRVSKGAAPFTLTLDHNKEPVCTLEKRQISCPYWKSNPRLSNP